MTQCCEEAGADLVIQATTAEESDLLLEARRLAGPAVMATGPTVIEDVCVQPGQLAEMLAAVEAVSADSGIPIPTVAHAGDGNLHPVLMLPDLDAGTIARAMAAGQQLCDHARRLGGTITGEHGVGVLKRAWVRQQLGPASLAVHQAIKSALDPSGILNPGRSF
jgi:glycolate oxidase